MGRREERVGREMIKEERERKELNNYKDRRKGRGCIERRENGLGKQGLGCAI